MTSIRDVRATVEHGLLTVNSIKGFPAESFELRERMEYYHVPGFSIALIDQSQIAWAKGYGVLEVGKENPVVADTIFQAASISKPVTAITALALVEAGVLDLDMNVNELLTSWQLPENDHTETHKVTLRRLLSHTAGLSVSGYRGYPAGVQLPSLRQILDGEPPANSEPVTVMQVPGEAFSYSGGGYILIQKLIEDVTNTSLANLAQELIFDKLGMNNSTFHHLLPERYIPQAASAHKVNGDPLPGKWHSYPEQATASLWSTPSDLAHLIIEILKSQENKSNKVLSTEMTQLMLTPHKGWMALGFVVVEMDGWTRFDHPGWNEGFHSYLAGFVGDGQGIVWMANGENGKALGHEVMRGLGRVLGWPEYHQVEKTLAHIDTVKFHQLAGKYRYVDFPEFGVEIVKKDEELFLQESGGGISYQLFPESELDFFCLPRPEKISFNRNAEGIVDRLNIGSFDTLEREE